MSVLPSSSLRYGSRDRFMIELSFEEDPVPHRATIEERVSWGALKIWANGFNLSTHYEAGELREAIYWNWWTLLRWLEANWNPLFHEQALPVRNAAEWAAEAMWKINRPETFDLPHGWDAAAEAGVDAWFRRHCLWSCREGGLLPNVAIRRLLGDVEVSWTNHVPPGAPDHFRFQLTSGGVRLKVAEVAEPLHQFLTHAAEYLAGMANTQDTINLVKRTAALNAAQQTMPRLGWLAGFGKRIQDYVQNFRDTLQENVGELTPEVAKWFFPEEQTGLFVGGDCQGALMFGAVAPALDDNDRLTLAAAMVHHQTPASKARKFTNLIARLDPPDDQEYPWDQGYELARAWIELCGLSTHSVLDMNRHLKSLGVDVKETTLSDKNTSGVALVLEDRAPLVLLNRTCAKHTDFAGHEYASGKRFTLAHELCHLLVDRFAGADLALVSGPWAPKAIEQRANAFAAALLMPNAHIDRAYSDLGSDPRSGGYEKLVQVAKSLDVSPDALSHHLYNKNYIGSEEREVLRTQWMRTRDMPTVPPA